MPAVQTESPRDKLLAVIENFDTYIEASRKDGPSSIESLETRIAQEIVRTLSKCEDRESRHIIEEFSAKGVCSPSVADQYLDQFLAGVRLGSHWLRCDNDYQLFLQKVSASKARNQIGGDSFSDSDEERWWLGKIVSIEAASGFCVVQFGEAESVMVSLRLGRTFKIGDRRRIIQFGSSMPTRKLQLGDSIVCLRASKKVVMWGFDDDYLSVSRSLYSSSK